MVDLSNKKTTYNVIGDEGMFYFDGYVIFDGDNKIVELQCTVTVHEENPETGDLETIDKGHVNFNGYSEDGRGTFTIYSERGDISNISNAASSFMAHIKEQVE